jgi:copper homeostasis protein
MKCELCSYTVDACHTAARLGIDRVELCASPAEGGVTPSMGTIAEVCSCVDIETSVMIRPRGGDFLYSDKEFDVMLRDIRIAHDMGCTGVVFGILTADGKVDIKRTRLLVEAAHGMDTTFHRAIDMTQDYLQAIEDVISTGCTRILTSGGHDKAIDGIVNISQAVSLASRRIEIMAGSGVSTNNVHMLAATGVDALHFSAKKSIPSKMLYHNPHISMGSSSAIDEYSLRVVDEEEVSKILRLVREHSR